MLHCRPVSEGSDRREFLGTALAAGTAGVLLRGDAGFEARIVWCNGGVHPLATKRLRLLRGGLSGDARVELWFEGAGEAARVVHEHSGGEEWDLVLSFNHPDVVAGNYRYWAVVEVNGRRLVSAPLSYTMKGFRFGA